VPDARLLIVGDGIERDRIDQLVGELKLNATVRLTGVRRDIPDVLAASDVSVLCSDREGLPIAVLEAMAAARPVVATRVGDLPLVVQDQKTGLLVDSNDVNGLADALEDLLVHPDRARQLGEAGRKLVEQQYSLERMVGQHQELYDAAP
jgi:glycosyltransferase involved in cell wall biosynthesis